MPSNPNQERAMPDVERIAAELRAALAGVTPGPWDVMTCNTVRAIDGDVAIPLFDARTPWKKHRHTSTVVKQEWHNCRYVVAAQPDNIRALLDELARQGEALKLAREAIQPFAEYAAYWSAVQDNRSITDLDGDVIATLDQFRRARAFLSTLEGK